jgi:hypothetical protein
MIEVRHASISFEGRASPEEAEDIVGRALRLTAGMLPRTDGVIQCLILPDVEFADGMDVRESADALAAALIRGIAGTREDRDA